MYLFEKVFYCVIYKKYKKVFPANSEIMRHIFLPQDDQKTQLLTPC